MTPSSILKGTAILLFLQGVSTVALNLCGIKFPPALLAMILLLVLLLSGVIRVRTIEDVCDILIEKMGRKQENINYKSDIIVAGSGNIKVNIAKCCKPIKGDAIIGYITKGEGITVHKKDCPKRSGNLPLLHSPHRSGAVP